ncbi:MAG: aldo/keto reductase [Clostridia bacterium]|nr:aldo/keto reductase [Clostridia bacterium]
MKYRKYGNTGDLVSCLGFGCMRLPEYEKDGKWYLDEDKCTEMLLTAYNNGVNYFDSAYYYCHSNSEAMMGKVLSKVRGNVKLTTKIPLELVEKPSDYRRVLEESLTRMGTDYVDYYHFWSLSRQSFDQKVLGCDLLNEAQKAKEEGLIRHISFSFHDTPDTIKYIIDTAQIMESMLVQYNILDRRNEEMIAYAASKGLGVAIMGPVGGGRLAIPSDLYSRLTGKPSVATYELALRFVLGNPNVSLALSGMQTIDVVRKNLEIASSENYLTGEQWEQISEANEQIKKFSDLYCTGCSYCQPCPAEINIPQIFNLYTHHNVYGLTDFARENYANYIKNGGKTIKDCQGCGFCESKCPQKLKIRAQLVKVEKILGSL